MLNTADGRIILATTRHRSGGPPFKIIYLVNETDPDKALEIVRTHTDPNVMNLHMDAWGPIPEAAIKALNLQPGEFVHFYD
jgi:hypothetical protein